MWTLPASYASELRLVSDSCVLNVHFLVGSFPFLFVSAAGSSLQSPLVLDAPSLKWKLRIWNVWAHCSGSGEHFFSTHSNSSHLVLGPDSELPEFADSWLLPVSPLLWSKYPFSSSLRVWSWSVSSSLTPLFFLLADFLKASSSSPGSSDLKRNQEENIGLYKYQTDITRSN